MFNMVVHHTALGNGRSGKVVMENGDILWISYGTVVGARLKSSGVDASWFTDAFYSSTTKRHISRVLRPDAATYGDVLTQKAGTFAEWLRSYGYSAATNEAPYIFHNGVV